MSTHHFLQNISSFESWGVLNIALGAQLLESSLTVRLCNPSCLLTGVVVFIDPMALMHIVGTVMDFEVRVHC